MVVVIDREDASFDVRAYLSRRVPSCSACCVKMDEVQYGYQCENCGAFFGGEEIPVLIDSAEAIKAFSLWVKQWDDKGK